MRCEFQLSDDVLCQLREQAQHERSVLHWFETDVRSSSGELVAKVRKQIYMCAASVWQNNHLRRCNQH